jgi:hypothetical protein
MKEEEGLSLEPLPPDALALVESPEAQLAKVAAIREVVLGQSDLQGTYREYAKLAGLEEALRHYKDTSTASLFEVSVVQREAERKMGQMLRDIPRHPGARRDLTSYTDHTRLYEDVLKELRINRATANIWQWAAQLPEEMFRGQVEYRRNHLELRPISLKSLAFDGQTHARKEAVRETRHEEWKVYPKVKQLAQSIPSYDVFAERLKDQIGDDLAVENPLMRGAVQKLIRRNYPEVVEQEEQQRQERQDLQQKHLEFMGVIIKLRHLNQALSHLASLRREGPTFRELTASLKPHLARPLNDGERAQLAEAIDFTVEGAKLAVAYLEDLIRELEEAHA